jgi:hypothetical protein
VVRTPDVVEFGKSPFSWRRHSCLLGRDSSRPLRGRHPPSRSAEKSLGAADTSVRATSWLRSISPTIRNPRPTSGVLESGPLLESDRAKASTACPTRAEFRTPDVVEFGMSPFSWRRHSCLLGRDSSRPLRGRHPPSRSAEKSLGAADTSVRATSWLRSISPTIRNPRPTSGVLA